MIRPSNLVPRGVIYTVPAGTDASWNRSSEGDLVLVHPLDLLFVYTARAIARANEDRIVAMVPFMLDQMRKSLERAQRPQPTREEAYAAGLRALAEWKDES